MRKPWLIPQTVAPNVQPGPGAGTSVWTWSLPGRRLDITDIDELGKVLGGLVPEYQLRGPGQNPTTLDALQGASLPQLVWVEVTAGWAQWTFNRGFSSLQTTDSRAIPSCQAMRDRYLQLGHPRRDESFPWKAAAVGLWVLAFVPVLLGAFFGALTWWVLPTAAVGWAILGMLGWPRVQQKLQRRVLDNQGVHLDQRPRQQVRFDTEAARQRRVVFWQTFAFVTPLAGFFGWLGNYLTS